MADDFRSIVRGTAILDSGAISGRPSCSMGKEMIFCKQSLDDSNDWNGADRRDL